MSDTVLIRRCDDCWTEFAHIELHVMPVGRLGGTCYYCRECVMRHHAHYQATVAIIQASDIVTYHLGTVSPVGTFGGTVR